MAIPAYQSRRAKILYALQRTLETIKITNGFATDVYKVSTSVNTWNSIPEHESPTLFLVDENTQYNYRATKLVERVWTVGIYGVMKNGDQYKMEELISDIEERLASNETLAVDGEKGPVSFTRIVNIITDNQLFSEIENSQLFKITVSITYIACIDRVR